MLINEKDNLKENCLCLGILNGSAKSFTKVYEGERNIQIIMICIGVFAFTIIQDFIRALWCTLKH
ncbi:hypothetical protein I4U23_028892 [Adineta vaga]|nr:hypothetical protein I4U23_028892 [Adineta vaga]